MKLNRETFFTGYHEAFGSLSQSQVDGLEFLLGKFEQDSFTLKQMAYVLATIGHETAHTFEPIKERRGRVGTKIRGLQDRYWDTGYYGRGFVQITWKQNYEKFGIADDPDKALDPETAYEIVSRGMREGLFTGKKLSDFINGKTDYLNARRIVNGLDRAGDIAASARKYEGILTSAAKDAPDKPVALNGPATDDGTQTNKEVSGAVAEPAAKEVRIAQMSPTTKAISFTMIGSAALKFIQEMWQSSQQTVVSAGQFALVHLPQTLLIIGLAALGVWIYNQSSKRAAARTAQIVEITANKDKNDVVIT